MNRHADRLLSIFLPSKTYWWRYSRLKVLYRFKYSWGKLYIPNVVNKFSSLFSILTTSGKLSMMKNAVWALSNLCRGKAPPPDFSKV